MADETVTFTIKGTDGKDVEIAVPRTAVLDAVSATHVPKDRVAQDLDRRVQSIIKGQNLRKAEELLEDEAFVQQVAEKHGLKKGTTGDDDAAAKQLKEAVTRALADQDGKVIKPLQEKLTAKEEREQALLVRDLERQIIQAAAPYVRESLLKSPGRGKAAPIVTMLEDAFAYDEETGEFYVADGDNFVLSRRQDKDSTYMTVDEYLADWIANADHADFVRPGQSGPGARGGGGGGRAGDGTVTLTADEASDHSTYSKALEKVGGDHSKIRVKRPELMI